MAGLTTRQIETFERDGFLFPLDLLSSAQAREARDELEHIERTHPQASKCLLLNAHYTCPLVFRLASHPSVVEAVKSLLGPNVLAWGSELFAKEPGSPHYVGWHQDMTYWGMDATDEQVTAWFALSDVNEENGCMRFLPGSHRSRELLEPIETFAPENTLSRGQELPVSVDESRTINVCLRAGQVSLHHGRMYHASGPNRSSQRRVGLTVRYVTPEVSPAKLGFDYATLIAGRLTTESFRLLPPPRDTLGEQELARFAEVAEHQQALYTRADDVQKPYWERTETPGG